MSGSGGSGGPSAEPVLDCGNISFNTDINSPNQLAIDGLNVQDKLNVELRDNKVVVIRQDTNDILGSINWSSIARLIQCLREDFEFVAVIQSIQDGLIKVHISAR